MMKHLLPMLLAILPSLCLWSQEKFTLSGYIADDSNGEMMIEATVFDEVSRQGTVSNLYGFYSITLPKDSVRISFSYVGYETQAFSLYLDKDTELDVRLAEGGTLAAVVVTAGGDSERIEEQTQMSRLDVPVSQIKKIPALLGEVDVLKALQLLPGVQSGGEGTSGLYVRGGSPDQNLILLDGVPVYNASHLFGFFSVFNADAIRNVTLTKGGFPARYGGRLSSVLDINMKEGNLKEYHGEGSIGLVASKMTLEGPIVKDKASFMVSARRTYIDLLVLPFLPEDERGGYYFYDTNVKLNYKLNKKHRLYLSTYMGRDVFYLRVRDDDFRLDSGFDWGNTTAALRWNYAIRKNLFANTTLTYSKYQFDLGTKLRDEFDDGAVDEFAANYISNIKDWGAKVDFDYMPSPNHYIRFGVNGISHSFRPGALQYRVSDEQDLDIDTIIGTTNIQAQEYFAYIEDDMRFGDDFSANVGLHFSGFSVEGKTYVSPQARLGLRYLLPNGYALKGSYAMMTQYIHLLTNDGLGLPTDLWVPSTGRIKPQQSWQAALGLAKTLGTGYELSVEGYYKQMDKLVAYQEGVSFLSFENWEDKVAQGNGESYGLEFFVQKKKGKTTGWIGYTLSWNFREFDEINGGERYPFKYDRRHDISVVLSHDFTKNVSLSGTWVYGSGNAITVEEAEYLSFRPSIVDGAIQGSSSVGVPSARNNYRMNAYHRADIGLSFSKQKRHYKRTFSLGAYNTYNRKNPFFIYYDDGKDQFRQVSLFPIIPYFSWSFKF